MGDRWNDRRNNWNDDGGGKEGGGAWANVLDPHKKARDKKSWEYFGKLTQRVSKVTCDGMEERDSDGDLLYTSTCLPVKPSAVHKVMEAEVQPFFRPKGYLHNLEEEKHLEELKEFVKWAKARGWTHGAKFIHSETAKEDKTTDMLTKMTEASDNKMEKQMEIMREMLQMTVKAGGGGHTPADGATPVGTPGGGVGGPTGGGLMPGPSWGIGNPAAAGAAAAGGVATPNSELALQLKMRELEQKDREMALEMQTRELEMKTYLAKQEMEQRQREMAFKTEQDIREQTMRAELVHADAMKRMEHAQSENRMKEELDSARKQLNDTNRHFGCLSLPCQYAAVPGKCPTMVSAEQHVTSTLNNKQKELEQAEALRKNEEAKRQLMMQDVERQMKKMQDERDQMAAALAGAADKKTVDDATAKKMEQLVQAAKLNPDARKQLEAALGLTEKDLRGLISGLSAPSPPRKKKNDGVDDDDGASAASSNSGRETPLLPRVPTAGTGSAFGTGSGQQTLLVLVEGKDDEGKDVKLGHFTQMVDWNPDRTKQVEVNLNEYSVNLWNAIKYTGVEQAVGNNITQAKEMVVKVIRVHFGPNEDEKTANGQIDLNRIPMLGATFPGLMAQLVSFLASQKAPVRLLSMILNSYGLKARSKHVETTMVAVLIHYSLAKTPFNKVIHAKMMKAEDAD